MKRHALAAVLLVPCVAFAAVAEPEGLSPSLKAGADEQPAFMLGAQGVQIYACKPKPNDSAAYAWAFVALAATPTESPGLFAGVTSIQRVATKGGVEPAEACDASKSGQEARVPYTADYYFYKRR